MLLYVIGIDCSWAQFGPFIKIFHILSLFPSQNAPDYIQVCWSFNYLLHIVLTEDESVSRALNIFLSSTFMYPLFLFVILYHWQGGGGGELVTKSCVTLVTRWTVAARLPCLWDSPGKNAGVGCHFLLQEIFPTEEWNPSLLHCRQILYQLSYKESPLTG